MQRRRAGRAEAENAVSAETHLYSSYVVAPSSASSAKLRAQGVPQGPDEGAEAQKPAECEANCAHHRPVRLTGARLLKRVFELDREHCPNCGSRLKLIAANLETPVIKKILTHLGLQARAAPRSPARGPQLQAATGSSARPGPAAVTKKGV